MRRRITILIIGLVSYAVASLLAGALVVALWQLDFFDLLNLLGLAGTVVFTSALLPFLAAVWLMHKTGRTGWIAHAISGAVVAYAAQLLLAFVAQEPAGSIMQTWALWVSGGVAGLAYWLVYRLLWHFAEMTNLASADAAPVPPSRSLP